MQSATLPEYQDLGARERRRRVTEAAELNGNNQPETEQEPSQAVEESSPAGVLPSCRPCRLEAYGLSHPAVRFKS
jgi:hypothetical protein